MGSAGSKSESKFIDIPLLQIDKNNKFKKDNNIETFVISNSRYNNIIIVIIILLIVMTIIFLGTLK